MLRPSESALGRRGKRLRTGILGPLSPRRKVKAKHACWHHAVSTYSALVPSRVSCRLFPASGGAASGGRGGRNHSTSRSACGQGSEGECQVPLASIGLTSPDVPCPPQVEQPPEKVGKRLEHCLVLQAHRLPSQQDRDPKAAPSNAAPASGLLPQAHRLQNRVARRAAKCSPYRLRTGTLGSGECH